MSAPSWVRSSAECGGQKGHLKSLGKNIRMMIIVMIMIMVIITIMIITKTANYKAGDRLPDVSLDRIDLQRWQPVPQ